MTARDLVVRALQHLTIVGADASVTAEDATFVLSELNALLDEWNAERAAVYADAFTTYTLTASLSPHTIGPSGTFNVTQRPVEIVSAGLILTASDPDVRIPIAIRDAQWWAGQSVKALSTSIPTDLYYEPAWPIGKLFFWPVPDTAYGVELHTRVVLASLALTDTFSLPPGYQNALTRTLAEQIAPAFEKPISADLAQSAAKARARVWHNNRRTPRLATRDAGVPGDSGGRTYNYLIGPYGGV